MTRDEAIAERVAGWCHDFERGVRGDTVCQEHSDDTTSCHPSSRSCFECILSIVQAAAIEWMEEKERGEG